MYDDLAGSAPRRDKHRLNRKGNKEKVRIYPPRIPKRNEDLIREKSSIQMGPILQRLSETSSTLVGTRKPGRMDPVPRNPSCGSRQKHHHNFSDSPNRG